jgi:hypothetical protein
MLTVMLATLFASAVACRDVKVPPVTALEDCQDVEHAASFPKCKVRDVRTAKSLNEYVERRVREEARYEDAAAAAATSADDCDDENRSHYGLVEASCHSPFVVSDILSYRCRSWWIGLSHPDGAPWAINVQVIGGEARPLELRDIVVSDAAEARLWQLIRADLKKQIDGVYADEPREVKRVEEKLADADGEFRAFNLTADGLVISYDHYTFGRPVEDAMISYRELRGILLSRLLPLARARH